MIEWFRHDTDARNDIKIRKLLRDNDPGALGAYWMCVEMIYQSGGYAEETTIAEELSFYNMDKFIPALVEHGLLEDVGNGVLTSQRVLSEIAYWEQTRQKKVEAGRKGGLATQAKSTNAKQCLSNAQAVLKDTKAPSSTRQDKTRQDNISRSVSKDTSLGEHCECPPEGNEESTDLFGEKVEVERDPVPVQKIVEYWNNAVKPTALPKVTEITKERRSLIRQRWKEYRDEVYMAIDKTVTSDFLTGRDGRWQMCDFDWVFTKKNMVKIFEGKYNRKAPANNRYNNGKSFKPHDINGQYDDEELEVITEL